MKAADFGSLFSELVSPERMHPQFAELLASPIHGAARALMDDLFSRVGDPNGGFLRQFQGDAFHSRLFELACFAYLEESGLIIDRSRTRPDFLVHTATGYAAVEVVTLNPPSGQATDISLRQMAQLSSDDLIEKVSRELPGRIGKSLHRKLGQGYQHLDHCRDRPLVFMVAPFFEAGSNFYTDDALIHPLFGAPEGGTNEIFPFFQRDKAAAVSAVLYCNQFTVSRFFRVALACQPASANLRVVRQGTCYRRHDEEHAARQNFTHELGSHGVPIETWAEGVTVFENPCAEVPLPRGFLPATCYVSVQDGFVTREVGEFHPVVSFMHVHLSDKAEDLQS